MADFDLKEDWTPEKRAEAAQWLIEKHLEKMRAAMASEAFVQWCLSLDLLLQPWVNLAGKPDA